MGLPPDFAPTEPEESGPDLAARALDAGAFVALPHPEWYGLTLGDALSMPEVHAVEAFNAIARTEGREGGAHLLDQMLNAGRRPGVIAVDDAHFYREDALGGWVVVRAEQRSPEAILAALKAGASYASTGPEIRRAAIEGRQLMVETSPVEHVALLGQGARSEAVAGRGVTRARLPLERVRWGLGPARRSATPRRAPRLGPALRGAGLRRAGAARRPTARRVARAARPRRRSATRGVGREPSGRSGRPRKPRPGPEWRGALGTSRACRGWCPRALKTYFPPCFSVSD